MLDQTLLIRIGGILMLGILLAAAMLPAKLNLRQSFAALPVLTRRLVWVHAGYVTLTITALGLVALILAPSLTSGDMLGRWVCGFIAIFWGVRVVLRFAVLHTAEYQTNWFFILGERALTATFFYNTAVFTWAALAPAGAPGI